MPPTFAASVLSAFGVRLDGFDQPTINEEFRNVVTFLVQDFLERSRQDTALYTQREVHYRNDCDDSVCALCQYYIPGGRCRLVDGTIDSHGCCDLWEGMEPPYKLDSNQPTKRVVGWNGFKVGITHEPSDARFGQRLWTASYGRLYGTYGKAEDGRSLDVWVGPDLKDENGSENSTAFWFQQLNPEDGAPDERKLVIGFRDRASAKQGVQQTFPSHLRETMFGGLYDCSSEDLNAYRRDSGWHSNEILLWLDSANRQRKGGGLIKKKIRNKQGEVQTVWVKRNHTEKDLAVHSKMLDGLEPSPYEHLIDLKAQKGDAIAFKTDKGSVYQVGKSINTGWQSTMRHKSAHEFHDAKDVGWKPPSSLTIYVPSEIAVEVGMWNTSSAQKKAITLSKDGQIILTSINSFTGQRGKDALVSTVQHRVEAVPALGLSPLELTDFDQRTGLFRGNHPGNKIVEIERRDSLHDTRAKLNLDALLRGKEAWQQRRLDYEGGGGTEHRDRVCEALAKNLPVPPEVMLDYPDLAENLRSLPRDSLTQQYPNVNTLLDSLFRGDSSSVLSEGWVHWDDCGCTACRAKRRKKRRPKPVRELEDIEEEVQREELAPLGFVKAKVDARIDAKQEPERFRLGYRYVPANEQTGREEYWAKDPRVRAREQKIIQESYVTQQEFQVLKYASDTPISGLNKSFFVEGRGDDRLFYKEGTNTSQADAIASEVLASQIARSVGINAPIARIVPANVGSALKPKGVQAVLQSVAPGLPLEIVSTDDKSLYQGAMSLHRAVTHPDLAKIYALDVFTGNSDRHDGNLMYDKSTNCFHSIDMGAAFTDPDGPSYLIDDLNFLQESGWAQSLTSKEQKNLKLVADTLQKLHKKNDPRSMAARFHFYRTSVRGKRPNDGIVNAVRHSKTENLIESCGSTPRAIAVLREALSKS